MRSWLLTANPTRQGCGKISSIDDIRAYQHFISGWDSWSVVSKYIQFGDRIYIMVLGQGDMNGIISYGYAAGEPYMAPRYDGTSGRMRYIDIEHESDDIYISQSMLKARYPEQCFSPQSSGISIKARYAEDLMGLVRLIHATGDVIY